MCLSHTLSTEWIQTDSLITCNLYLLQLSASLTFYTLLILIQPVLLSCQTGSVGGEDKEESFVSIYTDAVAE